MIFVLPPLAVETESASLIFEKRRDSGKLGVSSHLPESTDTTAGIGTLLAGASGLPRFHRAGPSTSLDKRTKSVSDLFD
jgi:hypothetical protein